MKPLSQFFAFEFSPISLFLCDRHNIDLLNQQTKATAVDFLKIFPSSFSLSCPISTDHSAVVVDGSTLFQSKPNPEVKTIRDYVIQLLENDTGIGNTFDKHVCSFYSMLISVFVGSS